MRNRLLLILLALALTNGGCTLFSSKSDKEAVKLRAALEVPPDLARPAGEDFSAAVTSESAVVIDTFRVDHGSEPERTTNPDVWAAVRTDIEKALTGELDVRARVGDARRRRGTPTAVRKARRRAFTRVSIDNETSPDYTVIDVHAADRPGLLFTIADCMYRLGLIIHLAKITTRVQQVLDVFYVTDAEGSKIQDPRRHEAISSLIFENIRAADAQEPALFGSQAPR